MHSKLKIYQKYIGAHLQMWNLPCPPYWSTVARKDISLPAIHILHMWLKTGQKPYGFGCHRGKFQFLSAPSDSVYEGLWKKESPSPKNFNVKWLNHIPSLLTSSLIFWAEVMALTHYNLHKHAHSFVILSQLPLVSRSHMQTPHLQTANKSWRSNNSLI